MKFWKYVTSDTPEGWRNKSHVSFPCYKDAAQSQHRSGTIKIWSRNMKGDGGRGQRWVVLTWSQNFKLQCIYLGDWANSCEVKGTSFIEFSFHFLTEVEVYSRIMWSKRIFYFCTNKSQKQKALLKVLTIFCIQGQMKLCSKSPRPWTRRTPAQILLHSTSQERKSWKSFPLPRQAYIWGKG